MNALLRWAGSKRQLLPRLREYWPEDARSYVEPFVGSGCLFFYIEPSRGILGDVNHELVSAYRALRDRPGPVVEGLRRLPTGRRAYYAVRSACPSLLPEAERAARFFYLNRYCFNGIYRTNRNGEFNVPFGDSKPWKIDEASLYEGARLLQRVQLVSGDFADTLRLVTKGDFVYLDPPYSVAKRRVFAEYDARGFGRRDLARLRSELERVDRIGATFLLSYADSREGRQLLDGWQSTRVRTRRNVSGFAGSRGLAYELLGTNNT